MHGYSRGLVEHQQIVVFEQNSVTDLAAHLVGDDYFSRFPDPGRWNPHFITFAQSRRRLATPTVNPDLAGTDHAVER
jgi:hypothetical protein